MENSLATTVATPAKWVGRTAPSIRIDTSATDTVVNTGWGYISSTDGTSTWVAPIRSHNARSDSRSRG